MRGKQYWSETDEQPSVIQLHGVYGFFYVSIIILSDIKQCQI